MQVVDTASGTFVGRSARGLAEQLPPHDAGRGGHRYRQARGERSHCPDGFVVRHDNERLQVEQAPSRGNVATERISPRAIKCSTHVGDTRAAPAMSWAV